LAEATWRPEGLRPAVFHGASLVLHVLAAWLVLAICLRLTGSLPAACAGALLFALHPVQVEPVAWASGAKDLLAGVLSLAAVWLFVMRRSAGTPRGRAVWIGLATLAYVLAMLAKPSAVVVPLVLLAVEWLVDRKLSRNAIFTVGVWLLLALPVVAVTRVVQPATGVLVPPLWQRPIIALDALGFYVESLIWPVRLAFVYGRTPEMQLASPWANVLVAVAAAVLLVVVSRRLPVVAAAAAISVAALLPYLGLVPFDFQDHSTVADHYLYVAMLGPAIVLAYLMRGRSGPWWAACAVVLVALGIGSFRQTQIWRDPMTLLRHAVATNPQCATPHYALGIKLGTLNQTEAAEREYRIALSISPNHVGSHTNLGQLLTGQGRHEEALEHYQRAVEAAPHDTLKMNNLAVGLVAIGRIDEAMAVLRAALEEDERIDVELLHANLGRLLIAQGRRDEARVELEKALAIDPDLEIALRGMQQLQESAE
jgi:Tfp pilus assembly protein PilF